MRIATTLPNTLLQMKQVPFMAVTTTWNRISEWPTESVCREKSDNFSGHVSTALEGLGLLFEVIRSHPDTPHAL